MKGEGKGKFPLQILFGVKGTLTDRYTFCFGYIHPGMTSTL